MSEATFSFTKLGDDHPAGKWGIAAWNPSPEPRPGDQVQVGKRDGTFKAETVGPEVSRRTYKTGAKIVYAIQGVAKQKPENDRKVKVTPGVFKHDGEVFVVKPNKDKTRLYAKRLVELRDSQGDRLTDDEGHVRFDYEYEAGAVYKLDESERMEVEEAKKLAVQYGRCISCGRTLVVAESVERGIGPVCIKSFRGWEEA